MNLDLLTSDTLVSIMQDLASRNYIKLDSSRELIQAKRLYNRCWRELAHRLGPRIAQRVMNEKPFWRT